MDGAAGRHPHGVRAPSFTLFTQLLTGWVCAPGRRTITAMVAVADPAGRRADDAYHRFMRDGAWSMPRLWQAPACHAVARFAPTGVVALDSDDTLFHKTGPDQRCRDLSELATYLNDAVLLAPSMLLRPNTSFAPVDDRSFDVTLVDAAQTVTGRVLLDDDWRPANFSTTDRYADLPGGLVRAEWTTPIDGWQADGDRLIPTRGSAIWQLPKGPLDYMHFRMSAGSVRYNLAPSDIMLDS